MTSDQIQKAYGVDRATAEQMVVGVNLETQTAQRVWLEGLPALKAKAQDAYDASFAKGGKNAHKRAVGKAREIWSSFSA